MPDENQETISNAVDSSTVANGIDADSIAFQTTFETIDFQRREEPVVPLVSEDQKKAETDKAQATESKAATGKEEEHIRYDQLPRFQELLSRAAKAEAKLELLEKTSQQAPVEKVPVEKPDLGFKDISTMTDQELTDWQDEDPKGYAANILKQAKHEIMQDLEQKTTQQSQQAQQAQAEKVYETYAETNPDFLQKWEAGELQKFMEANPGPISAHMAMSVEQRISEAVAKAEKETEARVLETLKNKGNARSFSTGSVPIPQVNGSPDELQNPQKYGGTDAVLLNRFLQRQRAQA